MTIAQFAPKHFPEIIETPRLHLKKHELSVAPIMFAAIDSNRERLREFLPWVDFTAQEMDSYKYIDSCREKWEKHELFDYGFFDKSTGEYVGNGGLHSISWSNRRAEFGYWILGKFEGKGFISEAIEALEKVCFEMGFHRLEIRCSSNNKRSASVPERLGYKLEGHLKEDQIENGRYRDTLIYGKLNPVV